METDQTFAIGRTKTSIGDVPPWGGPATPAAALSSRRRPGGHPNREIKNLFVAE